MHHLTGESLDLSNITTSFLACEEAKAISYCVKVSINGLYQLYHTSFDIYCGFTYISLHCLEHSDTTWILRKEPIEIITIML